VALQQVLLLALVALVLMFPLLVQVLVMQVAAVALAVGNLLELQLTAAVLKLLELLTEAVAVVALPQQ
jgi:hypothetical protein